MTEIQIWIWIWIWNWNSDEFSKRKLQLASFPPGTNSWWTFFWPGSGHFFWLMCHRLSGSMRGDDASKHEGEEAVQIKCIDHIYGSSLILFLPRLSSALSISISISICSCIES